MQSAATTSSNVLVTRDGAEHPLPTDTPGVTGTGARAYGIAPATKTVSMQSDAAANLALTLGWFSLGVGLVSLMMPSTVARIAGIPARSAWLRAMGTRELISGAGILLRKDKPGWLWSRVAGDVMDLSLLTLAGRKAMPQRRAVISAALAGITVLDLLAAYDRSSRVQTTTHTRSKRRNTGFISSGTVHVKKSLEVNCSAEACYRFWRDIENFPRFMQHVHEVNSIDATRSRWRVEGPLGRHISWETELTSDIPSQQLGWRTKEGSDIAHAGMVRFTTAPGGRGTRVELDFQYHSPMGKAGVLLAKVLGEDPSQQLSEDLRRFKQLIETGEIPTTIGQPSGKRSLLGRFLHQGASR